MSQRTVLLTGIVFAGLGVCFGAFGAHALKEILATTGRSDTYELAVRYQFYHAFAMLVAGICMQYSNSPRLRQAVPFFAIGIILFSGSLYVLSLTGITLLGAVTPFGGLFFIMGWLLLFAGVYKK